MAASYEDERVTRRIEIPLGDGRRARAVRVGQATPAAEVLAALELPPARGLVVLNGGTADLGPTLAAALRRVIAGELARVAAEERLTLLTGGTRAGIFALLGDGLDVTGLTAPCIGVVPRGLVTWPGGPAGTDRVPLEPHHSHFVLVEGSAWGDETAMLAALSGELARTAPSIVVLASGGVVARREVAHHVRQAREVVVVAGSGRLADDIAAALDGDRQADPAVSELLSGRLTSFQLAGGGGLDELIRRRLGLAAEP
jgi:SLOG in TRPM, prokaryote